MNHIYGLFRRGLGAIVSEGTKREFEFSPCGSFVRPIYSNYWFSLDFYTLLVLD